jgi:hypothetical protein
MIDQPQFDRLRQTCSVTLQQFVTEAYETEQRAQSIRLPVGVQGVLHFMTKHQVEYKACHEYLLASKRLADFLEHQLRAIQ